MWDRALSQSLHGAGESRHYDSRHCHPHIHRADIVTHWLPGEEDYHTCAATSATSANLSLDWIKVSCSLLANSRLAAECDPPMTRFNSCCLFEYEHTACARGKTAKARLIRCAGTGPRQPFGEDWACVHECNRRGTTLSAAICGSGPFQGQPWPCTPVLHLRRLPLQMGAPSERRHSNETQTYCVEGNKRRFIMLGRPQNEIRTGAKVGQSRPFTVCTAR